MPKSASDRICGLSAGAVLACAARTSGMKLSTRLIVAMVARWRFKTNFVTLSGWVAGAMTSSPALPVCAPPPRRSTCAAPPVEDDIGRVVTILRLRSTITMSSFTTKY